MAPSRNTRLLHGEALELRLGERFHLGPVTLTLRPGEHLALLGPSGSGKSTLLRILTGHQAPSEGKVTAFGRGRDVSGQLLAGFEGISHVWQDADLPPFQRVRDSFRRALAAQPNDAQIERIEELSERFGIQVLLEAKPEELSLGQRQRCAIALAFSTMPQVLALDEPFSHQDPWQRQRMLEAVRQEASRARTTLILCTHNLEEAHYLTRQAYYLLDGKSVYQGPLTELASVSLPEVTALYGWASAIGTGWEVLEYRPSEEGPIRFQVRDCLTMPGHFLLVSQNRQNMPVWARSPIAVEKRSRIGVYPSSAKS